MTNERSEDEMLGRALARAIETQDVRETRYEGSRIADRPGRRGFPFWQLAGVAAALVLAVAFGSWFTRPQDAGPVASSPTPTAEPSASPAQPSPTPRATVRERVYFARDLLPPVGVDVDTEQKGPSTPETRIAARLTALATAKAPSGLVNVLASSRTQPKVSSVKIEGDLARVDYAVPNGDWGIGGAAATQALIQQLVYTATEEVTVRRVLFTENGGKATIIDGVEIDGPRGREDVDGYDTKVETAVTDPGTANVPAGELSYRTSYSVDTFAPALARFVIQIDRASGSFPQFYMPKIDVKLLRQPATDQSGLPGEASLWVTVDGPDPKVGLEVVDRSPLRSVNTVRANDTTIYQLKLDAAYPWRVFTLANPTRVVVDIGGAPQAVSDRIAVYAPRSASTNDSRVSRTFTVSGAARTFEANVVWRLKDSTQKVVAQGHTTASLGTSPVWGTFETEITIPASVSGNVTLEVFEASPKDGSDEGLVAIPLTIR